MKTITKEITLFKLSELPEDTQRKVISSFRDDDPSPWESENADTLKAFTRIFPVKVRNYEYEDRAIINFTIDAGWDYGEEIKSLSGPRLMRYIYNNYWDDITSPKIYYHPSALGKKRTSRITRTLEACPLTGYIMDNAILDPLVKFLANPSKDVTFEELLEDCLHSWLYACRDDYEFWMSEPSIREDIEANDYDFTEDGRLY